MTFGCGIPHEPNWKLKHSPRTPSRARGIGINVGKGEGKRKGAQVQGKV